VDDVSSVKEYGSTGKRTRIVALQNRQIRGNLVTLANAGMKVLFRPAHIEGEGWFRKRRDCLRMGYQPSVDGLCLLTQTAANKGEQG
jgi:hypothetical protein